VGNAYDVGDEVLTAGGIVGYVIDIDGDRITLETSVGASFVVLRQYVLRKIEPVVSESDEDDEEDDPHEDDHDHDQAALDEGHGADDDDDEDDEDEGAAAADEEQPAPRGKRGKRGKAERAGSAEDGEDPSGSDSPPII
jgi:hypothetical protein